MKRNSRSSDIGDEHEVSSSQFCSWPTINAKHKRREEPTSEAVEAMGPRLCPVYLQDVAQFLSRVEITRLRVVSSHCKISILSIPADALPLRRHLCLDIVVVSAFQPFCTPPN